MDVKIGTLPHQSIDAWIYCGTILLEEVSTTAGEKVLLHYSFIVDVYLCHTSLTIVLSRFSF